MFQNWSIFVSFFCDFLMIFEGLRPQILCVSCRKGTNFHYFSPSIKKLIFDRFWKPKWPPKSSKMEVQKRPKSIKNRLPSWSSFCMRPRCNFLDFWAQHSPKTPSKWGSLGVLFWAFWGLWGLLSLKIPQHEPQDPPDRPQDPPRPIFDRFLVDFWSIFDRFLRGFWRGFGPQFPKS